MKTQQGFTLIEAMITLAILGIGLAGSAKLQSLVFSSMLDARAQHEALQFTLQEIENLRHQIRYGAMAPVLPIHKTHQGIHSHYRLQGQTISPASTPLPTLEFNIRWKTPGTNGNLTVSTLFTDQPYSLNLYRLKNN